MSGAPRKREILVFFLTLPFLAAKEIAKAAVKKVVKK